MFISDQSITYISWPSSSNQAGASFAEGIEVQIQSTPSITASLQEAPTISASVSSATMMEASVADEELQATIEPALLVTIQECS